MKLIIREAAYILMKKIQNMLKIRLTVQYRKLCPVFQFTTVFYNVLQRLDSNYVNESLLEIIHKNRNKILRVGKRNTRSLARVSIFLCLFFDIVLIKLLAQKLNCNNHIEICIFYYLNL